MVDLVRLVPFRDTVFCLIAFVLLLILGTGTAFEGIAVPFGSIFLINGFIMN